MSGRKVACAAGAVALLFCGSLLMPGGAAAQESCQSAQCHATLVQGSAVHEAAESCDNCHEATATPHPQKGQATFKLLDAQPALCTGCHDAVAAKPEVHEALADGCTTCHSPHASNTAHLLLNPQKELCADCHSEPGAVAYPHGPVEAGRLHRLPHAAQLRHEAAAGSGKGDALCVDCHSDISDLLAAKKVKHRRSTSGCTSCHQPHGGAHPKLLAEEGPALCFQCHDDVAEQGPEVAGRPRRARIRRRAAPPATRRTPRTRRGSCSSRRRRPVSAATRKS